MMATCGVRLIMGVHTTSHSQFRVCPDYTVSVIEILFYMIEMHVKFAYIRSVELHHRIENNKTNSRMNFKELD